MHTYLIVSLYPPTGTLAGDNKALEVGMLLIGIYGKDNRGRQTNTLDYNHCMELLKQKKRNNFLRLQFADVDEAVGTPSAAKTAARPELPSEGASFCVTFFVACNSVALARQRDKNGVCLLPGFLDYIFEDCASASLGQSQPQLMCGYKPLPTQCLPYYDSTR